MTDKKTADYEYCDKNDLTYNESEVLHEFMNMVIFKYQDDFKFIANYINETKIDIQKCYIALIRSGYCHNDLHNNFCQSFSSEPLILNIEDVKCGLKNANGTKLFYEIQLERILYDFEKELFDKSLQQLNECKDPKFYFKYIVKYISSSDESIYFFYNALKESKWCNPTLITLFEDAFPECVKITTIEEACRVCIKYPNYFPFSKWIYCNDKVYISLLEHVNIVIEECMNVEDFLVILNSYTTGISKEVFKDEFGRIIFDCNGKSIGYAIF
jgi:hypothetical protein